MNTPPKRYNHMFVIAFTVISNDPQGEDVTPQQLADAIGKRVDDCLRSGEMLEAVGAPEDSFEED